MRVLVLITGVLLAAGIISTAAVADDFPQPRIEYAPQTYHCPFALEPPVIDGLGTDRIWLNAARTAPFTDIEGILQPAPWFETRAAMAWDDDYFYIFAELEEPHVFATLTERDSVIYFDNDFEVFIDPDGDTHNYYELEINALGTVWDLFLTRPYRDGAEALNAWDIAGLKSAVHIDGTLNDPSDTDAGWSVEIAIPWDVLSEAAGCTCPPDDGDRWWVNFSRVQWDLGVAEDEYYKEIDAETGEPLPEHNWVWSPQGLIAMHYPERWGIVQFSDEPPMLTEPEIPVLEEDYDRIALYEFYYILHNYHQATGTYDGMWNDIVNWSEVALTRPGPFTLQTTHRRFEVAVELADGTTLCLTEDGRLQRYGAGE